MFTVYTRVGLLYTQVKHKYQVYENQLISKCVSKQPTTGLSCNNRHECSRLE